MAGNTFLRISDFVLIEFKYKTNQMLESSNRFLAYSNLHDKSISLVNWINSRETTGNTEELLYVDTDDSFKAIVDVSTAFYYPNSDPKINGNMLPVSVGYMEYDTIRVHIRSGYNFQNNQGFLMRLFLENIDGGEFNILSQAYFKSDISMIKFNNTPINISEVSFDKYVEFKVLNAFDILDQNTNNHAFIKNIAKIKYNPMIFAEFSVISRIDTSKGFIKLSTGFNDVFSIPLKDSFSELSAYISEKNLSYFEYSALWDGEQIEDRIYALNSISGNDYIIEHQISVYEQVGSDFIHVETLIRRQESNYNSPLKYRPVLSNIVDGSLQIEYVVRLFNRNDGISVSKNASINSTNVNAYTQEPTRISVDLNPTIKVYNKIVKKEISNIDTRNQFETMVVVPMYFESNRIYVGTKDIFDIFLVPFDNVYELSLVKEIKGQEVPYPLDLGVTYYMVFKDGSNVVRIKENNNSNKSSGILNFLITSNQADSILKMGVKTFYINIIDDSGNDLLNYETNVATGNWIEKGKEISIPSIESDIPKTIFDTTVKTVTPTATSDIQNQQVKTVVSTSITDQSEFSTVDKIVIEPAIEDKHIVQYDQTPVIQTDEIIAVKEIFMESSELIKQRLIKKDRRNLYD